MTELDATLRDGRTLHVYDEGDPHGVAVVAHHGSPSSGRLYPEFIDDARARGIRLVGYDRPGYGGSSAQLGRSVGDAASDVAELLDALGAEGLDFLEGMGELNTEEFDSVLAGAEALEPVVRRNQAEMFSGGPAELRQAMLTVLSPVDQEAFTPEVADWIYAVMSEGAGERIEGWRDDDIAFTRPWGFDPAAIRTPALLLQGVHDLMVPPAHGRWLAARIPGVEAEISEADGHITLLVNHIPDVHEWLLERF